MVVVWHYHDPPLPKLPTTLTAFLQACPEVVVSSFPFVGPGAACRCDLHPYWAALVVRCSRHTSSERTGVRERTGMFRMD